MCVPKMAIPCVGWLAYVKDPDGNIFGLMPERPGREIANRIRVANQFDTRKEKDGASGFCRTPRLVRFLPEL